MYVDDEEKKLFLFWNQCFSYHIVHCGLQLVSIFLECFFGGYISLLIPLILEISRLSYIFTVMKSRAFLLSEMKSSTYFAWIISLSLTTAKHCVLFASFTSVIHFTNKTIFSPHSGFVEQRKRMALHLTKRFDGVGISRRPSQSSNWSKYNEWCEYILLHNTKYLHWIFTPLLMA